MRRGAVPVLAVTILAFGVAGVGAWDAGPWFLAERSAPGSPPSLRYGQATLEVAFDPALLPLRASNRWPGGVPFDPETSELRLRVGRFQVSHRVMAIPALPSEQLSVVPQDGAPPGLTLRHGAGTAEVAERGWRWTAPEEPGAYALRVEGSGGVSVHLNLLVLHPRSLIRNGVLNGYRIGEYRTQPLGGNPVYEPPRGFVEVGPGQRDILVSPHFTLEQFLCKQPGDPAYLAASPPLYRKLETILAAVNRAGYAVPTLHVMSGFRTPWYNRSIGNRTTYSRHLWGDAADIFVDADRNGEMDDLDGDGRVNYRDAQVLYRIVEGLDRTRPQGIRDGGLGLYRRNAVRGPFVHVDARGTIARW